MALSEPKRRGEILLLKKPGPDRKCFLLKRSRRWIVRLRPLEFSGKIERLDGEVRPVCDKDFFQAVFTPEKGSVLSKLPTPNRL
jgi:hypothetical protein